MKPPAKNSAGPLDLTQETIRFWEGRYGRPISPEEAREMMETVAGYFSLLSDWDHQATPKARKRGKKIQ